MVSSLLTDLIVYGLAQGCTYALVAVGFTLVYGVARILNLAHGAFYMISGYVAYFIFVGTGMSLQYFPLTITVSLILTMLLGIAVYRGAIRPLISSETNVLMTTLALYLFFEQLMVIVASDRPRYLPTSVEGLIMVFGTPLVAQRLLCMIIASVAISLLWLFIRRAKLGKALRAVAVDREAASLMGINVERINLLVMAVSAGLAGLAGVMITPLYSLNPDVGLLPLTMSFIIVVFAGLGSVEGSILAAFIISFLQVGVGLFIASWLADVVPLVVLLLVLLFRPSGLFGKSITRT